MKFPRLVPGRLVRRYKRFFADVELDDGQVVVSHCANPGSMKTCAEPGARVWLSESDNPKRKLKWTWELLEDGDATVCVNTARANQVIAEAFEDKAIAELAHWDQVVREVKYGQRSRVDFLLSRGDDRCYVEVKSVTLDLGGRIAGFPDSVTERGRRHLEELMAVAEQGHQAVMLFSVNRTQAVAVRPADEIDPAYGDTLRRAADAGVQLLAYRSDVTPSAMTVASSIPVEL